MIVGIDDMKKEMGLFPRRSRELHIVGRERDRSIGFYHEIAFPFDIARIEVVHVRELHDNDTEHVLIAHALRREELWPATEELSFHGVFVDDIFSESRVQRNGVDDGFDKVPILLECDGSFLFGNHFARDFSGHRKYLSVRFQCISDTDFMRITREWYHVVFIERCIFI